MKPLDIGVRITCYSTDEIVRDFKIAAAMIRNDVEFNERKIKEGPLMNALIVAFLSLNEKERVEFAKKWTKKLEERLSEPDPKKPPVKRKP